MKKILIVSFAFSILVSLVNGQGCVVVRSTPGAGQYNLKDRSFSTADWQIGVNNHYFKAYKTYLGSTHVKTLDDSNVIKSYSLDITATRFLSNGWSITLDLPIGYNSRTTRAEHSGTGQPLHTTSAFGLGDIRLIVYKWLFKPSPSQKINVQLGLGIKLPTGDYQVQDYFHRNHDSTLVLAPVSFPVQLGDGGTGFSTELNTFFIFNNTFSLYGNFYYLFNPRNQNGVSTLEGVPPNPPQLAQAQNYSTINVTSVTDQFSLRAGLNAAIGNWLFSVGARTDGVPVHDAIGRSDGLRRAGHNVEVEPGVLYNFKKISVYFYLPILVYHHVSIDDPEKIYAPLYNQITGKTYAPITGGSGDVTYFFGALFNL
ncbi:MAG: hypothetical protein ACHQEM_01365 [Chitinophagales bacterium]